MKGIKKSTKLRDMAQRMQERQYPMQRKCEGSPNEKQAKRDEG